jgi:hypothetical protein
MSYRRRGTTDVTLADLRSASQRLAAVSSIRLVAPGIATKSFIRFYSLGGMGPIFLRSQVNENQDAENRPERNQQAEVTCQHSTPLHAAENM